MPDRVASPFADDLQLALRLADEASALALEFFHSGAASSQKPDGSVVTDADLAVERMLTDALTTARPSDCILGEELGATGDGTRRWILDPIDGTRGFVVGRPDWGVHIALEVDGQIVVGVVTRPVANERWWASRGAGAFAGELASTDASRRLRVSNRKTIAGARVSGWLADSDPAAARLRSSPAWVESLDLDAILRVAEGHLDALVDGSPSQIWDRAPFAVLLEEAGGRYRDHFGGRDLFSAGGLFTNGHIDAELDELLARTRP